MSQVTSTENAILLAAEEEFIDKGFSGARTVTIAQSAGVTHAMFHYYFRTKEQLFERVFSTKLSLIIDSVFNALDNIEDNSDVLSLFETFMRKHYQILADNSKLPLFILNEIVHNPERIEMLRAKLHGKLRAIDNSFGCKFAKAINLEEIASIDLFTLITDILMLNLSSIVMRPLFHSLAHQSTVDYDAWRIEENITLIKKRLVRCNNNS